ncbi:MAG: response regulator [Patescibacteria group bacterium]
MTFVRVYGTIYAPLRRKFTVNRVLVVDDEDFMRRLLNDLLTRDNENARVVFAGSVEEAATMIGAHDDFGVLLTDFELGDGTGNEVGRRFAEKFPHAVVVGMTGNPENTFDPGIFKRVLNKPFKAEDKAVLDSLCS